MVFHGKWYDEVAVGESFSDSLTVTETHIVLAADKPKHKGGMVEMKAVAKNQCGEIAVEANGKMLVASRPA